MALHYVYSFVYFISRRLKLFSHFLSFSVLEYRLYEMRKEERFPRHCCKQLHLKSEKN